MIGWLLRLGALLLLLTGVDAGADEQTADRFDSWLDARVRGESVEQDNGLRDATAITLRTRLGLEFAASDTLLFLVEAENIYAPQDDYNSTTNGRSNYAVVADPEDTEINRALLRYSGINKTAVSIGRQKLVFDNARYLGNVGWRQNEQTFDAISVRNTSFRDTTIEFAYIDTVRRIFGPDSPNGKTAMSSPVLNVHYSGFDILDLTAYAYFLSFDDAPLNSNRTLGVRLSGSYQLAPLNIRYLAEFAAQDDHDRGASNIDANYLHAQFSIENEDYSAQIGIERLGGDGSYGFQTPLATGHAFNGWSDQFLLTPASGLRDTYIGAGATLTGFKLRATWHDFTADTGGADYGTELNLLASRSFAKRFVAGVKFADYRADTFRVDTTKIWLFLQFKYAL